MKIIVHLFIVGLWVLGALCFLDVQAIADDRGAPAPSSRGQTSNPSQTRAESRNPAGVTPMTKLISPEAAKMTASNIKPPLAAPSDSTHLPNPKTVKEIFGKFPSWKINESFHPDYLDPELPAESTLDPVERGIKSGYFFHLQNVDEYGNPVMSPEDVEDAKEWLEGVVATPPDPNEFREEKRETDDSEPEYIE